MRAGSQPVRAAATSLQAATHWRATLWRKVRASLPGLGVWVVVCLIVYSAGYILFEGWAAFTAVASDPLWWLQRLPGSLIFWIVCDIDQYKPRWRAIPSNLVPIAAAGLSFLSLLGKHTDAWPFPVAIALLAFGLDWLLIRRWRSAFTAEQNAAGAEAQAPLTPAHLQAQ